MPPFMAACCGGCIILFYGILFSSPPNLLMLVWSISDNNWQKIKVAHSPAHCCHYPPEKKGMKETGPSALDWSCRLLLRQDQDHHIHSSSFPHGRPASSIGTQTAQQEGAIGACFFFTFAT